MTRVRTPPELEQRGRRPRPARTLRACLAASLIAGLCPHSLAQSSKPTPNAEQPQPQPADREKPRASEEAPQRQPPAQSPQPGGSLAEDYATLRNRLATLDRRPIEWPDNDSKTPGDAKSDPSQPDAGQPEGTALNQRARLLLTFVESHGTTHAASREVLATRCQLAAHYLQSFQADRAETQFEAVLKHAPLPALDARGRALFGLAQAAELQGEDSVARSRLQSLLEDPQFRGSRYARFATIAQTRLKNATQVQVGAAAPSFGARIDLDGKSRSLDDLLGEPALVIFFSLSDEASHLRVQRVLEAAHGRGDIRPERVFMFALQGDLTLASSVRTAKMWKDHPILLCDQEFVDSTALLYAIHELPTTFLLGSDSTILARNPTPRRLSEALERLR